MSQYRNIFIIGVTKLKNGYSIIAVDKKELVSISLSEAVYKKYHPEPHVWVTIDELDSIGVGDNLATQTLKLGIKNIFEVCDLDEEATIPIPPLSTNIQDKQFITLSGDIEAKDLYDGLKSRTVFTIKCTNGLTLKLTIWLNNHLLAESFDIGQRVLFTNLFVSYYLNEIQLNVRASSSACVLE